MRSRFLPLVLLSSSLSGLALADDSSQAPAATVAAVAEPRLEVHLKVEAGIGTTFVARGVPQFAAKTDMATVHLALLTLENLGPGSLTIGYFLEAALTNPDKVGGSGGISPQIDPIVSYAMSFGQLQTSIGYFLHAWPAWASSQHPDGMHELQLTAAIDGWPVRPAIEVDIEFVRLHGAYANFSLSKTFAWKDVSVTGGVLAGVHGYDKPFGTNFDMPFALREVTASIDVIWRASPPFYVTLRGAYSYTGIKNWWMEDSFLGRSTPVAILSVGAAN